MGSFFSLPASTPVPSISLTSVGNWTSGTAGTWSAYTELISSTSIDGREYAFSVGATDPTGNTAKRVRVQVATGIGGSEVVIGELRLFIAAIGAGINNAANGSISQAFTIPRGTRISARSTTDVATAADCYVTISISG